MAIYNILQWKLKTLCFGHFSLTWAKELDAKNQKELL